jgi:hypothetical protein
MRLCYHDAAFPNSAPAIGTGTEIMRLWGFFEVKCGLYSPGLRYNRSMTLELRGDPETGRIRWTRRAVRALADSGLIDLEAFELLDGELIQKVKNPPHILAFVLTLQRLSALFGALYCQPEGPLEVALADDETNLPEPDLVVLTRPLGSFRPRPEEVRLLVEIADSTRASSLRRNRVRRPARPT